MDKKDALHLSLVTKEVNDTILVRLKQFKELKRRQSSQHVNTNNTKHIMVLL